MPDIFGRVESGYTHLQDMNTFMGEDAWERHQRARLPVVTAETPYNPQFMAHDFDSLGRGHELLQTRNPETTTALGLMIHTGMQIMTMVDEIYYQAARLDQFVALNTSIAEGAISYAVQVMDRTGKARRISDVGDDVPTATVSRGLVPHQLHYYGLDAKWSIEDLRQALFQGIPLSEESIQAAVVGHMEEMEDTGFTGSDYAEHGLFNLPYSATPSGDQVHWRKSAKTFAGMSQVEIRTAICRELSAVITDSREIIGRQPGLIEGMTVYLSGPQYDELSTRLIGDNQDKSIRQSLMDDNPWTHFTGRPLNIERVIELEGIGDGDSDRMLIALRNNRIAEMGVPFGPRLIRILDEGRFIRAQLESKFSTLFVKRPSSMRYVDGI